MRILKFLYPGLRIKRWLFLCFIGMILIFVGAAMASGHWLLLRLELTVRSWTYNLIGLDSPTIIGVILFLGGLILAALGISKIFQSLGALLPGRNLDLLNLIYRSQTLKKGPQVVVIGGGTGLSVLLRGLKKFTSNLTAIVTVSDDGGSSGRLRAEMGIIPPGDIRSCLVALADTETLMDEVLSYRFTQGEGLSGHSLGNLLLVAMSDMAGGLDQGIQELSKVLALRGQVIPSTLSQVVLGARLTNGEQVEGESEISKMGGIGIQQVYLNPANPPPVAASLAAIAKADLIVLGPGSLYTSVLPNLLVEGVVEALCAAKAQKVYICNVMTQDGETNNFTASDHVKAIYQHCSCAFINSIIVNNQIIRPRQLQKYEARGAYPVQVDTPKLKELGVSVVRESLLDASDMVRHDPNKLAHCLMKLILPSRQAAAKE